MRLARLLLPRRQHVGQFRAPTSPQGGPRATAHRPQSEHHPTHLLTIPRLGGKFPTSLQIHPRAIDGLTLSMTESYDGCTHQEETIIMSRPKVKPPVFQLLDGVFTQWKIPSLCGLNDDPLLLTPGGYMHLQRRRGPFDHTLGRTEKNHTFSHHHRWGQDLRTETTDIPMCGRLQWLHHRIECCEEHRHVCMSVLRELLVFLHFSPFLHIGPLSLVRLGTPAFNFTHRFQRVMR